MVDQALDFSLGETAEMIRDTTARFASERIAPLARRIDRDDWFPRELWPEMGALGLHGITVEEEYGGGGPRRLRPVVGGGGGGGGPRPPGSFLRAPSPPLPLPNPPRAPARAKGKNRPHP